MAMIYCPKCREKISEDATACPKCGNPISADDRSEEVQRKIATKKGEAIAWKIFWIITPLGLLAKYILNTTMAVGVLCVLMLATAIAFIVLLIMFAVRLVKKQPKRRTVYSMVASFILFLVFGFTLDAIYTPPEKQDESAIEAFEKEYTEEVAQNSLISEPAPEQTLIKPSESKPKPTPEPTTIEALVDSAIEKAGAEKEGVQINDGSEGKIVQINLKGKSNLTVNLMRTGMHSEAAGILKQLQGVDELSVVSIYWSLPMADAFGNTSDDIVMGIIFGKETLGKINFDNFIYSNIPIIADKYIEHPAFKG